MADAPDLKQRLYTRRQGKGPPKYYADFRDYAAEGGGQEAMCPEGSHRATRYPDVALTLCAKRYLELANARQLRDIAGVKADKDIYTFARHHLIRKAKVQGDRRCTERWLQTTHHKLSVAIGFFAAQQNGALDELEDDEASVQIAKDYIEAVRAAGGMVPRLTDLGVDEMSEFAEWLAGRSNGRGGTLESGTVRHYLNCISNLYERAQAEKYVPLGYNPIEAMMEKPTGARKEARWLEVHDAAWYLAAARRHVPRQDGPAAMPYGWALVSTLALTGGRLSEVLGLTRTDVNFERGTVTFRRQPHRRLKTLNAPRVLPLWPQLREVLLIYLNGPHAPTGDLLFPSVRGEREKMVTSIQKLLDAISKGAGWERGEVTAKVFRHTYCAARLQTMDQGAPVAKYTVGKELGHGGMRLVDRIYGHLGEVRHRAEVVEYRVEQHEQRLAPRLALLRAS